MVKRIKALATFGAGPFATGDSGGRFGHYNSDDVPQLLGVFLAYFNNESGPQIKYQTPADLIEPKVFPMFSSLIIPKPQLFCRSIKIGVEKYGYKVLGYPVGLDHEKYDRSRYTFNMCFVVDWESTSDAMYEPIVQKCAEYFIELEQEFRFLTNPQHNEEVIRIINNIFTNLQKTGESVTEFTASEDQIRTLYFKLCPSYRGIEPPEISQYMVPMFIREVDLTERLVEKMDVLSQKIIPQIDGIRTVREISISLELDYSLVARCIRNLHFYECVSLVPMFLYWNTYVATERVHDFYMNKTEIQDCLDFVKIRENGRNEATSKIPMPSFSDVFRLYLSMKCGIKLADWVRQERPRSMGVDEHRLVQFGMHHQFLRKLTIYPICTVPHFNNAFLKTCNGKASLEDLALENDLDPETLYKLLDESKKFEFVMK